MKSIVRILAIFLVQCAYLRAEPEPTIEEIGKLFGSEDSCVFGVKSVAILMSNSTSTAKNISTEEICQSIGPSKLVAFIIHGFISSGRTPKMRELATRLTEKGYTVFATDWSQGACTNGIPFVKLTEYPSAVQNTREIGDFVARNYTVDILLKRCGIPLKNIIFIGHSLGAHVAGFAAKKIKELVNEKPTKIIAADPANPLFDGKNCRQRCCKTDADCVIVVHTSSLGMSKSVGHMDLYFNEGMMQPDCGVNIACSHSRSISYIGKMISGVCGFLGVPIENKPHWWNRTLPYPNFNTTDCIFMSSNILDKDICLITGQYYIFVNKTKPYCTQETFNCKQ